MIGNRDKLPGEATPDVEKQQINARKWQIRWNFKEIAATDMMPASWQYDYVDVDELSKKNIKTAIIRTRYDHNDELGVINDQSVKPAAYQAYQDLRAEADVVIGKVL